MIAPGAGDEYGCQWINAMTYQKQNQRGSVMLVTAVSIFGLLGALGLAADLGRVYIVKNEAQAFADLAVLAAAAQLNGKSTGIDAAKTAVANSTNAYNFGTQAFASGIRTVEFATKTTGGATAATCSGWTTAPSSPYTNYGCVRVTVTPSISLAFMPVLGASYTQQVTAKAIGAVVPQSFPLGGYMPFTPFAHNDADPNYGFILGEEYAFRWPGNLNSKGQACEGDQVSWPTYNFSDQVAGSTRGYFELQSAAAISSAILGATQLDPLAVGDVLNMTNGNKQSEAGSLSTRASYDTDQTNYAASKTNNFAPPYTGNDMREVVMPVNSGPSGSPAYSVLGFASFLLYPSYSGGGGNQPWCAIYMGSSTQGGSGGVFNVAGAYVVRLVQ
jgi:Flp pilus assembly protein TadG